MRFARLYLLFACWLALPACDSRRPAAATETVVETPAGMPGTPASALDQLRLKFSEPAFIDSSHYLLYPLLLAMEEEESSGFKSRSYNSTNLYWNIAFYNAQTGESHLLSDNRKLVIYTFQSLEEAQRAGAQVTVMPPGQEQGHRQAQALLYYSVVTDDFNRDGELTSADPSYLFVSDKAGRNFRQISPAQLHVNSWEVIQGTGKILLHASRDTNQDKQFTDEDEVVPLLYDLTTNAPAAPVFGPPMMAKMKTRFAKHWVPQK